MNNLISIKVKINRDESNNLLEYLNEIINHYDQYSRTLGLPKQFVSLMYYHLETLRDKLMKLIFNKRGQPGDKYFSFEINKAERLTLFNIITFYPLPTYLAPLDFTIKNGLVL